MKFTEKEKAYIASMIKTTSKITQKELDNFIDIEIRNFGSAVGKSIFRVEEYIEATEALKQNPNGPDFQEIKSLRLKVQKEYLKSLKAEAKKKASVIKKKTPAKTVK